MDTRGKIISFDDAVRIARERPVRWVTGHFDPLLPEHTRRIREVASPERALIVVVTDPPAPLLPLEARAELMAALALVDYVAPKRGLGPADDPEDAGITRAFVDRVLRRNRGEAV